MATPSKFPTAKNTKPALGADALFDCKTAPCAIAEGKKSYEPHSRYCCYPVPRSRLRAELRAKNADQSCADEAIPRTRPARFWQRKTMEALHNPRPRSGPSCPLFARPGGAGIRTRTSRVTDLQNVVGVGDSHLMNPIQTLPAGVRACGQHPCARIPGIKKPAIAAGFYTLRASRAVGSVSAALPNFHHRTVKNEQFCE